MNRNGLYFCSCSAKSNRTGLNSTEPNSRLLESSGTAAAFANEMLDFQMKCWTFITRLKVPNLNLGEGTNKKASRQETHIQHSGGDFQKLFVFKAA